MRKLVPKGIRKFVRRNIVTKRHPKHPRSIDKFDLTLNCSIAYNELGGYAIPLSSRHRLTAQEILKGRIYEKETIDFIKRSYNFGDIIHAGTYFGDFLPALSRVLDKSSAVWAFEANVENYKCAKLTLLINSLFNVNLENYGLSDQNGTKKFVISSKSGLPLGGGSKIIDDNVEGSLYEEVDVVSIDSIVPEDRHISIIHLDIEGHEQQALQGGLNTIKRCMPILIFEDNSNIRNSKWFEDKILTLGYRRKTKINMNYIYHGDKGEGSQKI